MEKKLQYIIDKLKEYFSREAVEGMKRYGISPKNNLGVSMKHIKKIASEFRKEHHIALKLWDMRRHEARIMASIVDDYRKITEKQMEE